jgi:hypothetical protein
MGKQTSCAKRTMTGGLCRRASRRGSLRGPTCSLGVMSCWGNAYATAEHARASKAVEHLSPSLHHLEHVGR